LSATSLPRPLRGPSRNRHQIFSPPLFSYAYELPIFYPLCFDIHPCNGGVYPPPPRSRRSDVQTCRRSDGFQIYPFSFHTLPNCFAYFCTNAKRNSFLFKQFRTPSEKHGVWGGAARILWLAAQVEEAAVQRKVHAGEERGFLGTKKQRQRRREKEAAGPGGACEERT
jgi:hypothetical protein